MRTTVVPAQVTTVEDRIMGSLGFSQLILLVLPIFIAGGLYAGLPPFLQGSLYKYILIITISVVSAILAIRIKGRIVMLWLVTIMRYNLRPKYYLFNKNTQSMREEYTLSKQVRSETKKHNTVTRLKQAKLPKLELTDSIKILDTISHHESNLRFEINRKGVLHVRFKEIEE